MLKKILVLLLLWLLIVGVYQVNKSLPESTNYSGEVHHIPASDIHFFADRTYIDDRGMSVSDQHIFDEIFRMINESDQYVLVDMFLFNDMLGVATTSHRAISQELVDTLIAKKHASPSTTIQVITDAINIIYGGAPSQQLASLEAAGINVIFTDLTKLRDSNPLYSAPWRTFIQWWGNSEKAGYLPNPFDSSAQKLSLRTYLRLFNFKANHRKIIVTDFKRDRQIGFSTLITSANPHDGSSAHSNIAVRVDAALWQDVIITESAVAEFSGSSLVEPSGTIIPAKSIDIEMSENLLSVQLLTEEAIKQKVIYEINSLQSGDSLDMAMFYIADRDVVGALRQADKRGVALRLLLDPNKDAFGREKGGVPNRQVAHELMSNSLRGTKVRWCATHGEQCHSKLLLITKSATTTLIQGSANFTRRNIGGYNLETNVVVTGSSDALIFSEAYSFFDDQWSNKENRLYSSDYDVYADSSRFKTFRYRVMEWTGLSSW